MADLTRFLGNTARSGQEIELRVSNVGGPTGTGTLPLVSADKVEVDLSVLGTRHQLSFEIHAASRGKPKGTCTVVYTVGDGKPVTDPNAKFEIQDYWINIDSKVGPRGARRYQMWRSRSNAQATDFQVGIIKAWMLPKANVDSGYEGPAEDALPPAEESAA